MGVPPKSGADREDVMQGRSNSGRTRLRRIAANTTRASNELIYIVARKYYTEEKSVDDIAIEVGRDPSRVRAMLRRARDLELLHVLVTPPMHVNELNDLAFQVQNRFELRSVVLVPGTDDALDADGGADQEAVLISCCRAAADYLASGLKGKQTLALPWGKVSSYVARHLQPRTSVRDLLVVPMVGVMGVEDDGFEANTIAAKVASSFGGHARLLAAPAIVDPSAYSTVTQLPLVQEVLERVKKANVVLTPIAAADAQTSTVVRKKLATKEEVDALIKQGAVGEIGSQWWFDVHGAQVRRQHGRPIGIGLQGLKDVVRRGGRVVAVVGGCRQRVLPLKVALEHKFVNVLISDHVTARELLSP
jgi:deoxyribonucleoside regulator